VTMSVISRPRPRNAAAAEATLKPGPGKFTEDASDTRLSLLPVGTA
jgi:hypothetical protein